MTDFRIFFIFIYTYTVNPKCIRTPSTFLTLSKFFRYISLVLAILVLDCLTNELDNTNSGQPIKQWLIWFSLWCKKSCISN